MTRYDADVETDGGATTCDGPRALLLPAREVPLGGIRAMDVRRSLPQRELPTVGAWCFLDRFGPQAAVMRVDPHPHIGLQTVTWPLVGEIRHRDSLGNDVVVRRGSLNIMTAGAGISHSEYSMGDDAIALDALQLWVALPEERRHGAPDFERHDDLPQLSLPTLDGDCAVATVVVGELGSVTSPATMHTPIVGAEIALPARSRVRVPLRSDWEHAIVRVEGDLRVVADENDGIAVQGQDLLYLGVQRDEIEVASDEGALVFLLGGEPFPDDIVMWWNFVGRSHEEVVEAREEWERGDPRYGAVAGHPTDQRVASPPLPSVRLTTRRRRL
ncbi:pirin family protein [Microbacterium oryzae]|uniref:pirin family protein n=1 Tax=Microbacterium oryzae TaxID=743009 RepID=UPI0025B1673D|nr:pirin family protein [Microbacterium oryzae]MDN3311450.1 pirin family protein [Microbacterium oryzae]